MFVFFVPISSPQRMHGYTGEIGGVDDVRVRGAGCCHQPTHGQDTQQQSAGREHTKDKHKQHSARSLMCPLTCVARASNAAPMVPRLLPHADHSPIPYAPEGPSFPLGFVCLGSSCVVGPIVKAQSVACVRAHS